MVETQHERMVKHLQRATEALERHRSAVAEGVSAHLDANAAPTPSDATPT